MMKRELPAHALGTPAKPFSETFSAETVLMNRYFPDARKSPMHRKLLDELETVYEIAQNLVALWESPIIKELPRSERNAAIEETRAALIEAVNHYATVARTAERPICNGRDAGSIPAGGTKFEG
jgi:hypothetical protein